MQINRNALFAATAICALASQPAMAEEGMWTFDGFPAEQVREQYGWAPDQAWLDTVRNSAVRLTGGCSASFVSPDGLILTNHHCVASCLFDNSDETADYLLNGFVADRRDAELKCPGQQAEVVTMISDVTPDVIGAIGSQTGEALTKARDAKIEPRPLAATRTISIFRATRSMQAFCAHMRMVGRSRRPST